MKKIKEIINKYNRFLITGHERPDGDMIGSALALLSLLNRFKKKTYVLIDKVPTMYSFLPMIKTIKNIPPLESYEVAILLECSDKKRIPFNLDLKNFKVIINIDHHCVILKKNHKNEINLIDPKASACAEIVYSIIKSLTKKITEQEALCIYVGLLTDTGKFQWKNTTSKTHIIASELLKQVDTMDVFMKLYAQKGLDEIKKIATHILNIKTAINGKVAYLELIDNLTTDEILNMMGIIKGIVIFLVFSSVNKNLTRVTMRAFDNLDVHKVAMKYGGGGHKRAAGCELKGDIEFAKKIILNDIRKMLKNYSSSSYV